MTGSPARLFLAACVVACGTALGGYLAGHEPSAGSVGTALGFAGLGILAGVNVVSRRRSH